MFYIFHLSLVTSTITIYISHLELQAILTCLTSTVTSLTGSLAVANEFCNIISELNLFQYIEQWTHIQGNTLDLILWDSEDLIHLLKIAPNHFFPIYSDHYIITFNLLVCPVTRLKRKSSLCIRFQDGWLPWVVFLSIQYTHGKWICKQCWGNLEYYKRSCS